MLISLNWIRDFVDFPADLDVLVLGEKFTRTTAEVETVTRLHVDARGLVCARVVSTAEIAGAAHVKVAELDIGTGKTVTTVTAAPVLPVGWRVVYAPPGACVSSLGEIGITEVNGHPSCGMILPGDALGVPLAVKEAIFLTPEAPPGQPLPAEWFDDWLIEVDNKSITHRPDLWGHYGIAREIAAILKCPLKPYPVVPLGELMRAPGPELKITIDDSRACRRYSGLVVTGVPTQPAPLWMQLRLGHIGMRPISGLVDLTNYVMADLGQPMHAFDADRVDAIEVGFAENGTKFKTLDGVERDLSGDTLMIQCRGENVAIAGVMGGLDAEVSGETTSLLLESANFEPSIVRRTATRLGLRTDASARFEKSLDPKHTVLAIQRFIELARPMYPNLKLSGPLADAYPTVLPDVTVTAKAKNVSRAIGREVTPAEAGALLTPLGFKLTDQGDRWAFEVPSFRATNDVAIEADMIEEIARCIGYDTIVPTMPRVSIRRVAPHRLHDLENAVLRHWSTVFGFCEIQTYLWYHSEWIAQLGYDPGECLELRNPAADGLHRLRHTLMPGLLAAVRKNRFHFPAFSIMEVGTTFDPARGGDAARRRLGLATARRGRKSEAALFAELKGHLEAWSWQTFARGARFAAIEPGAGRPWERAHQAVSIYIGEWEVGRAGVIDLALRHAMDEHLAAWGIAWAEICLDELAELDPMIEPLGTIPSYPRVELDFSLLVDATVRFADVVAQLERFQDKRLLQIRYLGSYEGASVDQGRRSLTFKTVIGSDDRTLTDEDTTTFCEAFEAHLASCGFGVRR